MMARGTAFLSPQRPILTLLPEYSRAGVFTKVFTIHTDRKMLEQLAFVVERLEVLRRLSADALRMLERDRLKIGAHERAGVLTEAITVEETGSEGSDSQFNRRTCVWTWKKQPNCSQKPV